MNPMKLSCEVTIFLHEYGKGGRERKISGHFFIYKTCLVGNNNKNMFNMNSQKHFEDQKILLALVVSATVLLRLLKINKHEKWNL